MLKIGDRVVLLNPPSKIIYTIVEEFLEDVTIYDINGVGRIFANKGEFVIESGQNNAVSRHVTAASNLKKIIK